MACQDECKIISAAAPTTKTYCSERHGRTCNCTLGICTAKAVFGRILACKPSYVHMHGRPPSCTEYMHANTCLFVGGASFPHHASYDVNNTQNSTQPRDNTMIISYNQPSLWVSAVFGP